RPDAKLLRLARADLPHGRHRRPFLLPACGLLHPATRGPGRLLEGFSVRSLADLPDRGLHFGARLEQEVPRLLPRSPLGVLLAARQLALPPFELVPQLRRARELRGQVRAEPFDLL